MVGREKVLIEEEGLTVTESTLTAPGGDYPLADVLSVESTVSRPMLVPVLLAAIGTMNLVIAMNTGHSDIFVASGLMFGAGLWFWFRGVRHVLTLMTPKGEQAVWFTRDEAACKRALEVVAARVKTLRGKDG